MRKQHFLKVIEQMKMGDGEREREVFVPWSFIVSGTCSPELFVQSIKLAVSSLNCPHPSLTVVVCLNFDLVFVRRSTFAIEKEGL